MINESFPYLNTLCLAHLLKVLMKIQKVIVDILRGPSKNPFENGQVLVVFEV